MSTHNPYIRGSRLCQAIRKLYEKLRDDVHFPPDAAGTVPEVFLGWDPLDTVPEYVTVIAAPEESFLQWSRMGPPGSEEEILVEVAIRVQSPSMEILDAWDRLAEIINAVESVAFDKTTQKVAPIGFDNEVRTGHVQAVEPRLEQADTGWIGRGTVRFRFKART